MKKILMTLAMMAVTFAMQAQTKFHDVECSDAKGAVKSITLNDGSSSQTFTFSKEGKLESNDISNAVYDANGYLQSASMTVKGQKANVSYVWENGRIKSQTVKTSMMTISTTRNYDAKGYASTENIDMGGRKIVYSYYDYKFDKQGNWISRKAKIMGVEVKMQRTIEYYK